MRAGEPSAAPTGAAAPRDSPALPLLPGHRRDGESFGTALMDRPGPLLPYSKWRLKEEELGERGTVLSISGN